MGASENLVAIVRAFEAAHRYDYRLILNAYYISEIFEHDYSNENELKVIGLASILNDDGTPDVTFKVRVISFHKESLYEIFTNFKLDLSTLPVVNLPARTIIQTPSISLESKTGNAVLLKFHNIPVVDPDRYGVYLKCDGKFLDISLSDTYLDKKLTNNTTYTYECFLFDKKQEFTRSLMSAPLAVTTL